MRVTTSIAIAVIIKSVPLAFGLEYLRSEAATDSSHSPSNFATDPNTTSTSTAAASVGTTATDKSSSGGGTKTINDEYYDYNYDYDNGYNYDNTRNAVSSFASSERGIDVVEQEKRSLQNQLSCIALGSGGCLNDSDCCVSAITKKGYCVGDSLNGEDKRCVECVNGVQCPATSDCENAGTANAKCHPKKLTLPGFEKMARGYDIFKSDPLRLGLQGISGGITKASSDPGFRDTLLHLDFDNGSFDISIGDSAVNIPKGYRLTVSIPRCSTDASTKELQTSSSLRDEMSSRIGLDISYGIGQYGFGFGSSSVFESNVDKKNSVTTSTTSCIQYEAVLEDRTQIALSENARDWFAANFQGKDSFPFVFEKYGTHILTGASFGAMKGATTIATEESREILTSNGNDFDATVKLGAKGFLSAAEGSYSSSVEEEAASSMTNASISVVLWSTGANTIFDDTAVKTREIPDILSISGLIEICDILGTVNVENFILSDCKRAINEHCTTVAKRDSNSSDTIESGICSYRTIECAHDFFCEENTNLIRPACVQGTCVPGRKSVELCIGGKTSYGPLNMVSMTARYEWGSRTLTQNAYISAGAITSTQGFLCFPPFLPPVSVAHMVDIVIQNEGEQTYSDHDSLIFNFVGLRSASTKNWIKKWHARDEEVWSVSTEPKTVKLDLKNKQ